MNDRMVRFCWSSLLWLGTFNISKTGDIKSDAYRDDWFHSFASLSTRTVILTILFGYMISILFWALLFYIFRDKGFVDIHCFLNAAIISLETITTVGYTVTDISFDDQPVAFILLYGEMMQSILMNSFCIGVVYARLSRALTRARSIIFSKKAVIREVNGEWYFMFQVCERRKHQLIESHVTCYCVQKTVNAFAGIPYQITYMSLDHPDDKLGGFLLLFLPAVIIHHIDSNSPLYPLIQSEMQMRKETPLPENASEEQNSTDLSGGKPSELDDQSRNCPSQMDTSTLSLKPVITESALRNHIIGDDLEICVMIEGTESVTSNSLQARYSYTADDIEFNMTFRPCVSINEKKEAVIDFNKFQELLSLDPRIDYHEDIFIQSII